MYEEQIKQLNDNVEKAIQERKEFLDSKMNEVAKVKIGEDAYDIDTGICLGKVKELYRYWTNQNILLDNTLEVHYRFESGDNSSRRYLTVGTYDELIKKRERELQYMKSRLERETK